MRQRLNRLREAAAKKKEKVTVNAVMREDLNLGKQTLHLSHDMHHERGIVWCWRCGAYGTAGGKNLMKACGGEVSRGAGYFLNRLRAGMTPRSCVEWPCAVGEGPPEGPVRG